MTCGDEDGRHQLFINLKQLEVDQALRSLVNVPDNDGVYPIHAVSSRGDLEGVRLLVQNGSNVNVQTTSGQTPLHYAVSKSHVEIVKLLLESGVNLNLVDQYGGSVFHRAASTGNVEVAMMLSPPQWQMKDKTGNTPLHYAAEDAQAKLIVWCVKTHYSDQMRYVMTEVKNSSGQSVQDLLTDSRAFEEVRNGLK